MRDAEVLRLSAAAAVRALKAGELSAGELFETYRRRAAEHTCDGARGLNCFTWLARGVMQDPGPHTALAGLPLAVKDLFCTEGVPSQAGSRILAGYRPPYTATAVARLNAAGATLLGKTNQDEFAMGSSNENSGFGPVLNPWDPERVPGGSSGGSAAAVAGGLAPCAIGTDTGGSIRQPAALCGVVGLKPTYGAVSRYGMIAFASSLDQAGSLTRDVTDAALLVRYMVGKDPLDATSLEFPEPLELPTRDDLEGIRLGVPAELDHAEVEPGVLDAFRETLRRAEGLGAHVEESVELPHVPHGLSAYYVLAPAEASSNLARFDGVRYGLRVEAAEDDPEQGITGMYMRTRHDGFGPEVKRRIMLGTYALSAGYYEAFYGRAQ
jgi:aspartyl-tRNA(Asn)/glutamyl-tRNA(Gln) amidotransferase subunit A